MFDRTHCWQDASSVSVSGSPAAASVRSTPNLAIDSPTSDIADSSFASSALAASRRPNTGFTGLGGAGSAVDVDRTCFIHEQYSHAQAQASLSIGAAPFHGDDGGKPITRFSLK